GDKLDVTGITSLKDNLHAVNVYASGEVQVESTDARRDGLDGRGTSYLSDVVSDGSIQSQSLNTHDASITNSLYVEHNVLIDGILSVANHTEFVSDLFVGNALDVSGITSLKDDLHAVNVYASGELQVE